MGTILSNNQTRKMKRDKNCQITSDFCMYTTMGGVRRSIYSAFILSLFLIVEAYDAEKIRNEATDIEMLEYGVNDNNDKMTRYDDASLTDLNLDYLLNSAEMNLIQPEDLDEIGKNSQSVEDSYKETTVRNFSFNFNIQPSIINVRPLTLKRQEELYKEIAPYVDLPFCNITCPKPNERETND
ncbi:hypothetical protein C1645_740709 [Glomus cerebriforme]|uniref:Uncharacterized protein n=1 Tax=Glomus cerebriforme TaxID=658196 RepID=A0A397SRI8_9GLOM|nr:hypothetical protein C1645_740709 [Glomus cerebriforme]